MFSNAKYSATPISLVKTDLPTAMKSKPMSGEYFFSCSPRCKKDLQCVQYLPWVSYRLYWIGLGMRAGFLLAPKTGD